MSINRNYWIVIIAVVSLVFIGIGVWIISLSVPDPEPPRLVNQERMNFGVETRGLPRVNETVIIKTD